MTDQTLTCAHCTNEFVFSTGEQSFYASKALETPKYCPICRSIKKQESLHPVRPSEAHSGSEDAKEGRSIKAQEKIIPPKPPRISVETKTTQNQ